MTGNGPPAGDPFQPHLEWGLKSSFVGYISSLADGRIEASNGVWQVGNALAFPVSPAVEVPENEIWFNGRVSFSGHGGMMKLNLIEPRIVNHDETITLTIDEAGERIAIAELTETSVSNAFGLVKTRFAAVLTEAGSKLFNGQYPAGQQMEEVEVVLRG
ncbi:HtaA domain-containing protein [Glutamicibacter arilaitensis]|uniref:HtaA domain-containing protein n=1 Tax=Glutamicibacter arilaitensis TaxID=256701 RepID=UPI003F9C30F0